MDRDRAPKVGASVAAASVNQQWMKEKRISRLHFDVDSRLEIDPVGGEEPVVHLIPIGFPMLGELTAMARGDDREASILSGTGPDRCPGGVAGLLRGDGDRRDRRGTCSPTAIRPMLRARSS